jgi:prolipoprotein diacylglyceryltransferase
MPVYLMLHGVKRVIIECFRGDGNPTGLGMGVLTDQQIFSIVFFVIGLVLFFYLRKRNPRPYPPRVENA